MPAIRDLIMANLVTTLVALIPTTVAGVVDDAPWDYAQPPLPGANNGRPVNPFVYVFEGQEQVSNTDYGTEYQCYLPVTVECTFDYSTADATRGLKPTGRTLLAALQAALMADPNRGGVAELTAEVSNAVEESTVESVGVVVWQGTVTYLRHAQDPTVA